MLTGGYNQEKPSRFNEQTRDESRELKTEDTKTAGGRTDKSAKGASDDQLLESIREDFTFATQYWSYNREQAAEDIRFVTGKFWTEAEKRKRPGRPCLEPDEISQYLKQTINNYRQNKRSVTVVPRGSGATDKDAQRRGAIIRGIIHASSGQAAFTTAFEGAVQSAFGFFGITLKQMRSGNGFNLEPRIRRIPNQFTVLLDPEALEADFSDQNMCFVTDMCRENTFGKRFRNATKQSFDVSDRKLAPDWFVGGQIITAEAWRRIVKSSRKRLKVRGPAGETLVYDDELRDGDRENLEVLDHRIENEYQVMQYITNGIEILDRIPWPGSWIPIIPLLGEEIYEQDTEGQSKRVFMSQTRRMKAPQKMVAFIASQEAEEFGMAPRSPLLIWEGQEAADKKALENLHTQPRAYIRLKPGKGPNGQPVYELPGGGRLPFEPHIQDYELAREAWRRSVQASAGIVPLATAAQRDNEKSGLAIERIENQEATGAYHFFDNADRALENCGRQLNDLITKVMDTPRTVGARGADEKHSLIQVSAAAHVPPEIMAKLQGDEPMPEGGVDYLISDRGEFDLTVSTGPDKQSEREDQSDFVDTIIKEAPALQLPQPILLKLVSIAVKMKNLGNFGDEIAQLLDPQDQTMQQLQQAQQQIQQFQEEAAKLAQEVQQLKLERAGKVVDNEYKLHVKQMEGTLTAAIAQLNADLKAYIANVETKAQDLSERRTLFQETQSENHHSAHEAGMQAVEHAHEHAIADKNAAIAQAQAAAQSAQPGADDQQSATAAEPGAE